MLGQWQLNQDAMHLGVLAQLLDECKHVSLRNSLWQLVPNGRDAQLFARLPLARDIAHTIRPLAHDHGRQTGHLALCAQFGDLGLDLFADGGGNGLAVNDGCSHGLSPMD